MFHAKKFSAHFRSMDFRPLSPFTMEIKVARKNISYGILEVESNILGTICLGWQFESAIEYLLNSIFLQFSYFHCRLPKILRFHKQIKN